MTQKGHIINFLLSSSGMTIKMQAFIISNTHKGESNNINISWDPDNENLKMTSLRYLYKYRVFDLNYITGQLNKKHEYTEVTH